MAKPFNGVSTVNGIEVLNERLNSIKKDIEDYYNALNLKAFSPPGAYTGTIPEKPAILIYVENIQSSGHLIMPGGLMQQPHIFMYEYNQCLAVKNILDSVVAAK